MPAQFRIDQATPGAGVAGQSRHDLIAGEVITLTATSPAPGAGITYSWEIIDKVGSTATLSAASGTSVTIGNAGLIVEPCAFEIELTVNDNGVISRTRRVCSVRTASLGLRAPLFGEDSPIANKLSLNDPDTSTDNAVYADLSGLGSSGQNWRGWAEWAWELVLAVESLAGGGGSGDATSIMSIPIDLGGGPADGQVLAYNLADDEWQPVTPASGGGGGSTFVYRPGGVQGGNVYDNWTDLDAAVSAVTDDQKIVLIDDTLGSATVPAGSWDINGWIIKGFTPGVTSYLNFEDGATLSTSGGVRWDLEDVIFNAMHTSGYIANFTTTGWITLRHGASINGSSNGGNFYFLRIGGFSNAALVVTMLRGSLFGDSGYACETAQQGQLSLQIYDGAGQIGTNAVYQSGSGAGSLALHFYGASPYNYAAQVDYVDAPSITQYNDQRYFNKIVNNIVFSAEQVGLTELHVGSIYLTAGTQILSESEAMIGGSASGETAVLLLRRFTGGTAVTDGEWSRTGTLTGVQKNGSTSEITDSDWYDLYLRADDAADTALFKGLRLVIVPSVENGV